MELISKISTIFLLAIALNPSMIYGQASKVKQATNFVFNADSLSGFDEEAAKLSTLSDGFLGDEFKVHMYQLKRMYINNKYKINVPVKNSFITSGRILNVTPACTNEDFEGSTAGIITAPNQINGWTVTGGSNFYPNNSCNLAGCCPTAPSESELIYCNPATGYIDPVIGGCYPIYSVFGSSPNNGNSVNPGLPAMGGDKIIRINNEVQDFSIEKLSKTFNVTSGNALFQFAFLSVFYPGHPCCDAGAFQIKLLDASNQVLACPNFSVSAPSSQCASTNTTVNYYIGGGACLPNTPSNSQPIFNKWNFNSLDLSAYIGQNITIEIIASDCTGGAHYGCVYFDAQCSPMTIIGNGNSFPAGTPNIVIPTCGTSGATITSPSGLGPYSWSSSQIFIPANLSVPSNTNTTLLTNQSGTVQLTMNPPGSCVPITKVITVTITPAPIALLLATPIGCTNTLSTASLTTAGSASVSPIITWNPLPASVSGNSLIASGLAPGITTVTVQDILGCQATATVNILPSPPVITFTINNLTGSSNITCNNPTLNLNAVSNYTAGTLTYNWTSLSYMATGQNVSISQPGNYTVCATDLSTGCSVCQVINIGINTTAPSFNVSPLNNVISCTNSQVTFTATSSSTLSNVHYEWYSPLAPYPAGPPAFITNGPTSIFGGSGNTGVYTIVEVNDVNGCTSTKTVQVSSIEGFPTFNVSSTTNFSLGCNPRVTTLCIINGTSAIGSSISFAFTAPGSISTPVFTGNSCITTSVAGTWLFSVKDVGNGCVTSLPLSVVLNTVTPDLRYTLPVTMLSCKNPTILATATSTTAGTVISWNIPVAPNTISSETIIIGPPNGPNTSPSSLIYPDYTVVATNTVNGCKTTLTVDISQDFRKPTPLIAVGNPSVINCNNIPANLSFTNNASHTGGFGIVKTWEGPSPQSTVCCAASYSAYVAGIYTLTVEDSNNGCTGTATFNVPDKTQPPVLVNPAATSILDCGAQKADLNIDLVGETTGMQYWVTEYPKTSPSPAFSPSNVTIYPGTATSTIQVDVIGHYEYLVTNTLTGCKTTGTFEVVPGKLTADFTPNTFTGFAPLAIEFTNNSFSSLGSGSVTSLWSYGNGQIQPVSSVGQVSTLYEAPGTYTVWLYAKKGDCVDSTYRVIKVEVPSKMEVPNVFTPNGDGSNDVFFMKTTGLSQIMASVYDRWGNKVYEVDSSLGNIAWDGTNFNGNECSAGTYFYIIKANGHDGKSFEQKGNISLLR